jgi:putative hydrolase of the HAD superfamily
MAEEIRQHPLEVIAGVVDTLAYLAPRHDLVMVTKGDADEQRLKIEASGLEPWFQRSFVVPEKDPETYRKVLVELGFDARRTWMIGNSPRSDINPALQVGMNAVLVPHPHTWSLEHERLAEPVDGQTFLSIAAISDLRALF